MVSIRVTLSYVVVAALSALAGIALGHLIFRNERRASASGLALLGLAAGLVIGLSSTPVIASVIAAAFGLVATLLPLYSGTSPAPPKLGDWLPPLSALVIVGLLLGIIIRVNELLYFPGPGPGVNLKRRYVEQGFTEEQASRIMEGHVKSLASKEPPQPEKPDHPPVSLLTQTEKASINQVVKDAAGVKEDAARVAFIETNAPALKDWIARLRRQSLSDKAILERITQEFGN